MRNTKLNRWRFQYSLRSLLLFTLFANLGMAWLCPLWIAAKRQREAVAALHAAGASVRYDYEVEQLARSRASPATRWSPAAPPVPPGPAWARRLLGDDFFAHVVDVGFAMPAFSTHGSEPNPITDQCLEHIGKLPRLEVLELGWSRVSDAGLKNLQRLTRLRELDLARTSTTDAGLEHLQRLTQLRELNLAWTKITDVGLPYLGNLTNLEVLDLSGTGVTEAGLAQLVQLRGLRRLGLGFTAVSRACGPRQLTRLHEPWPLGLEGSGAATCEQRLRRAFPRCQISLKTSLFLG